jgi:protein-tyrosine-phosphatase
MRCGFALDQETAAELEEQVGEDMNEDYKQIDPDDVESADLIDALGDALEDPEAKTKLLEKLTE